PRLNPPAALDVLAELFSLSLFEKQVVLLCAGVEFDSDFAASLGAASPTFSLALAKLEAPHWSALAPEAPLRYWRLVQFATPDSLTRGSLRLSERVLHYLAGLQVLDPLLAPLVEPVETSARIGGSHEEIARRMRLLLRDSSPQWPVLHLSGSDIK